MFDLYLTSTFTNQWNRDFNPQIGKALEDKGIICYLPHRDTDQTRPPLEKFNKDIEAIDNSTIILAVALNESPNWGAEVGYAYGTKKPVVALTDNSHAIPLICEGMISEVFRAADLNDIDTYIDDLTQIIRKYTKQP